jgi:hypothetical protein
MNLAPRASRLRYLKSLMVLGFAAGLLTAFAPVSQAGSLEQELLRNAPQLMKNLRDKGYKNVGVLKFRVRKGNAEPSDSVGTLNLTLANRTEMALVLVNDPATDKQIGIIQDASSVAAKLNGASHLNREGLQTLFGAKYPLAWGKEQVKPDALVFGEADITADLREMKVSMGIVDKQVGSSPRDRVIAFTVPVESDLLSEMGESFLVRGLFTVTKATKVEAGPALAYAANVKANKEPYPLDDKNDPPVSLEIWYGKTKVPFTVQGGRATIPTPQPNEKVVLRIVRNPKNTGRYGIVLKVNGENTIFQQKGPDYKCLKWVLEPEMKKLEVFGYAVKGEDAWRQFKVLTPAAARGLEVYYGHDIGTISMTVYAEQPPDYKKEDPKDENYAALAAGYYPEEKSDTLAGLQHAMREYGADAGTTRGLVAPGVKVGGGGTREVGFKAFPSPALSATISYYQGR